MQEQAGQLGALAQEVPTGGVQQIMAEIDNVASQASAILGGAAGQNEIGGAAEQAKQTLDNVGQALEAFAGTISQWSQYHANGGA